MPRFAKTTNLSATAPGYVEIDPTSPTGEPYDWILDPWRPGTRGFALSADGVWRATGLQGGAEPAWEQVLDAAGVATATGFTPGGSPFQRKICASINQDGYLATTARAGSRAWYLWSEDGGDTWDATEVLAASDVSILGGVELCPRRVGGQIVVYMSFYSSAGRRFYRSANGGASFSHVSTLPATASPSGPSVLMCPYDGNTDGNTAWLCYPASSSQKGIFRTTDGGANFTEITLPSTTTVNHQTRIKRLGVEVYTQNSNLVAIWNEENRLFRSTDGGANFSEVTYSGYVPGTHGHVMGAAGFPFPGAAGVGGSQYYIITSNRYIFVSVDAGATWTDKSGNFRDVVPSNPTSDVWPRNGVVVPDWTE